MTTPVSLSNIYLKAENQQVLHPQPYVEGVLFGAGVTPEIPMPDAWLTWTIANHGQMRNTQQADQITDALFAYFKQCLAMMTNNEVALPTYILHMIEELKSENLGGDSDISKLLADNSPSALWLNGLLQAHAHTETVWQNAWKLMQAKSSEVDHEKAEDLAKKLKHSLSMFSTFADIELAKQQAISRGQQDFEAKLPLIAQSLPSALSTYVEVSGELAAYLPNQFETFVQKKDPQES